MDFASDYTDDIGFAVQKKSLCVCDSTPHAIYTGEDAEKQREEREKTHVGQFFDLGVAEEGQTCRAVCESRFSDEKEVKSARELLEEQLDQEAKQMGYKNASDPEFQEVSNNAQYEDICECDLEFNIEKSVLELKSTESFKANQRPTDEYELRTMEHWMSQEMEQLDKDVVYATIAKGDTTTCSQRCKTVANINKSRAVRDHTAEFLGLGAEATPQDDRLDSLAAAWSKQ